MEVVVHFTAQLRHQTGIASRRISLPDPATTRDLLCQLQTDLATPFSQYALQHDGTLQPSILLCVNETQVPRNSHVPLRQDDQVYFLSAISGG